MLPHVSFSFPPSMSSRLYWELAPLPKVSLFLIFQEMPQDFLPKYCTVLSWLLPNRKGWGGFVHLLRQKSHLLMVVWQHKKHHTDQHACEITMARWGVHLFEGSQGGRKLLFTLLDTTVQHVCSHFTWLQASTQVAIDPNDSTCKGILRKYIM